MSHVYRYLTDDGLVADGSNEKVISASGDLYYAGPAEGKYWHIERMLVYIEDGTAPKINEYGGATALTNGHKLNVLRGGASGAVITDLLGGITIKSNGDWGSLCYDLSLSNPGSGNGVVLVRWTFGKSGSPLVLSGAREDKLVLQTQDALNALVDHRFMIQGVETNDPH